MQFEPVRDAVWRLSHADRPDLQTLAAEIAVKRFDLGGQFACADWTPGRPEIQEQNAPLRFRQKVPRPVEALERGGGRITPPGPNRKPAQQWIEVGSGAGVRIGYRDQEDGRDNG